MMGRYGVPVDRFYGRPMDVVTWGDEDVLHSDPRCRVPAGVGVGRTHRATFSAEMASRRMCGCCSVEPAAADNGLADAVVDLVMLCEVLAEEADEVENREDPDYTPDFLRSDHSPDHWRTLQSLLSITTKGLRAHPWLHTWARPVLSQADAYTERRCEEQRTLVDTGPIERAAALQQREQVSAYMAQSWQDWRQRQDPYSRQSPDRHVYDRKAREQRPSPVAAVSTAASTEFSVRLPPMGADWDGMFAVETLSEWEMAGIVAYQTSADWAGGVVTLSAPLVVVQEFLRPARALGGKPLAPGPAPAA